MESLVSLLDRWTGRLSKMLMIIAALWAFVLAIYILVDVIMRSFGIPFKGTHEVVKNSIVMIAFMQVAYCVLSRSMLRADFVLNAIRAKSQGTVRVVDFIGYILGAGFFLILLLGTIDPAIHAIRTGEFEGEGALRVPTWPARVVVLATSALLIVNYLMLAVKEIVRVPDAEQPV